MTQAQIKKQITNDFLSIAGIGFVNHEYLLAQFGLKPQMIAPSLIAAAAGDHPNGVVLIGSGSCYQTYLNAEALMYVADYSGSHLFELGDSKREVYAAVLDGLLNVDEMPVYESLIAAFELESGKGVLPAIVCLGELHGNSKGQEVAA